MSSSSLSIRPLSLPGDTGRLFVASDHPPSPASSDATLRPTTSSEPLVPSARVAHAMPVAARRESAVPTAVATVSGAEAAPAEVTIKWPAPCAGRVARGLDGRLRCSEDHGVDSVLALLHTTRPGEMDELQIPAAGAHVTVGWDDIEAQIKMNQFLQFAGGDLVLATDLLRSAIDGGRAAFGPGAVVPGTGLSPIDFLATVPPRISVREHADVQRGLQELLTPTDARLPPRLQKFREDFGAVSLLSLVNSKDFDRNMMYGLVGSLAGTGAIGASFDYGVWPQAKKAMGPAGVAAAGPVLDGLTPLLAETFDSMVIKRLMEAMKGGRFLPDNAREAFDNLKDAAFAGAIAALGSVPNNYVREQALKLQAAGNDPAAKALLVVKQFTNLLATLTSGAIVPLDVKHAHAALIDARMTLIDRGTLARPGVADVRAHVSESTLRTLRAARGTGSAIRSVAAGAEIAATIGLLTSLLEFSNILSPTLEQLVTLLYSTPTEVLGMMSAMAAERWIGHGSAQAGARITTDAGKQSALLAQVATNERTTLDDLDRIARPPGEWNAEMGYAVTQAMGTAMGHIEDGATSGQQWLAQAAAGMSAAISGLLARRREPHPRDNAFDMV